MGGGDDLLHSVTKPIPKPMLNYQQRGIVALIYREILQEIYNTFKVYVLDIS